LLWISGRTDVLAALGYGTAVLCHLHSRPLRPRSTIWLGLCVLGFLLALAAKEMALTLPAVLLLHGGLFPAGESRLARLLPPALCAGIAVAYLLARTAFLGGFQPPPHPFAHGPGDPDMLQRLLSAPILYLADLVLFVPPDPVVTYPFWVRNPVLFLALAAVTAWTLVQSVRSVPDRRVWLYALGWTALTLLPVLLVSAAEHFLYLPSIGYCLLIGAKLRRPPGPLSSAERRGLWAVGLLVLAVTLAKTLAFGSLAARSRQSIDDTLAAVDDAPQASIVLVADLPAVSALGFAHALRLERPERGLHVEILSVAPHFLGLAGDFRSRIQRTSARTLLLDSSGYLGSYIELAFLGRQPVPQPGQTFARTAYEVRGVETLEVRLHRPLQTLLLHGRGFRLLPLRSSSDLAPEAPSPPALPPPGPGPA
jgi:hypothetical protein